MIVSHKNRFIFLKTAKAAGSSIELLLAPFCGEDDIITSTWGDDYGSNHGQNFQGEGPDFEFRSSHAETKRLANFYKKKGVRFEEHMCATMVRSRVGDEIWDSYFKFCFVRNPWDRAVSAYHFARDRVGSFQGTFDDYLRTDFGLSGNGSMYADLGGTMILDEVYRFEDIPEALKDISSHTGLQLPDTLEIRAKESPGRADYRNYYDFASNQVILSRFNKEIKLFGYEF